MSNSSDDGEVYGPEFEVWNHLDSGIELARMELNVLDDEHRRAVEKFGEMMVNARRAFALGKDQQIWLEIYDYLLKDAWYRHAAEIELGWEGIHRAAESLTRFTELRPVLTNYRLSERTSEYLREVVDTFLFGFDAACIALCGATVEQVLRDLVVEKEIYSEARLKREQPTGLTLLKSAKCSGVLLGAYAPAERVLEQRNRVMHRHMWEKHIIRVMALRSIEDLGEVLVQLGE